MGGNEVMIWGCAKEDDPSLLLLNASESPGTRGQRKEHGEGYCCTSKSGDGEDSSEDDGGVERKDQWPSTLVDRQTSRMGRWREVTAVTAVTAGESSL